MCKFDRDPVICLREEAIYMYIMYIVTNRLQYNTSLPLAGEVTIFEKKTFKQKCVITSAVAMQALV